MPGGTVQPPARCTAESRAVRSRPCQRDLLLPCAACPSAPKPSPRAACISACGRPPPARRRSSSTAATRPLAAEPGGYFAAAVAEAGPGTRYRFRLDGGERALPDPASRCQPDGPHGPSEVIDPGRFAWSDAGWRGVPPRRLVIYEMHVGSFTPEGSWAAATARLPALAELGITCIEMMPVAEFPGRF